MSATYRVPVLENFVWQPSVKEKISQAGLEGLTPARGDRYLLTDGANVGKIAYCTNVTGPAWSYDPPLEGMIVWVNNLNQYWHCTGGTTWVEYLGQQGTKGNQGTKGSKGDQGTKGSKGDQGTQGTKGDQGTKGSKGDQGTKGSKGDTGATGPGATYDEDYDCLIIST
jgi:hypothetical protein